MKQINLSKLHIAYPVYYDEMSQTIFDANGQMILNIRGWGYLIGTGGLNLPEEEAVSIQNSRGIVLSVLINDYIRRQKS